MNRLNNETDENVVPAPRTISRSRAFGNKPQTPRAPAVKPNIIPSRAQANLLEAVFDLKKGGTIVLDAKAGTGKTTSLIWVAFMLAEENPHLMERTAFVCFGREPKAELEPRIPEGATAQTIYSLGWTACRSEFGPASIENWVDDYKYEKIAALWFIKNGRHPADEPGEIEQAMLEMIKFVRLDLLDFTNKATVEKMCLRRALETPDFDVMFECLQWCLEVGVNGVETKDNDEAFHPRYSIDYVDQVWLPNYLDLDVKQYDLLFVDECQDLSKAQLGLVQRARTHMGKAVFVGDPSQAVFGFAGADPDSFERIVRTTKAQILPLDLCFRCGNEIIALAQTIVPDIYAAPTNGEGKVDCVAPETFRQYAGPRDMIVCRTTAPLIRECLAFIRQGRRAKVKGRDIGASIVSVLKRVSNQRSFRWNNLIEVANRWCDAQVAVLSQKKNADNQIQSVCDRVDSLIAVYEGARDKGVNTVEGLVKEIYALFSDVGGEGVILLSTIHRAKGLEANTVWFMYPHLCPHPMAKTPDAKQQELHLEYVGITRAQKRLYFVIDDRKASWGTADRIPEEGLVPTPYPHAN